MAIFRREEKELEETLKNLNFRQRGLLYLIYFNQDYRGFWTLKKIIEYTGIDKRTMVKDLKYMRDKGLITYTRSFFSFIWEARDIENRKYIRSWIRKYFLGNE